jgi:hypothetical protein
MSLFGRIFGDSDSSAEQGKDKGDHSLLGWPTTSNDPKAQDAGSSTTGQSWSELDPDGRGSPGWSRLARVDLLFGPTTT